jgi:NTE family protein
MDNLPIAPAALGTDAPPPDLIVAVDVGNAEFAHEAEIHRQGFAAVFMRSASLMMHELQAAALARWQGPPVLLVRPRVGHIGWFTFGRAADFVEAGYRAACDAFAAWDTALAAGRGIHPRRAVRVDVDRARCTGCGLCVALAPDTMALDGRGKAYARAGEFAWSPADGGFVGQCPTRALQAVPLPVPATVVDVAADDVRLPLTHADPARGLTAPGQGRTALTG